MYPSSSTPHQSSNYSHQSLDLDLVKHLKDFCLKEEVERIRRNTRGWIGEGPYTSKHPAYVTWRNMIQRCNARCDPKKLVAKDPDCWNGMPLEWMDFQNFAAWWDAQHESQYFSSFKLQIDKDLFCVWSRLYSPDTCALLPAQINILLKYYDPAKGVKQRKRTGKWYLTSQKYGKRVARNSFDTMDEAYFARLDLIRAEVISIAAPMRHIFSERVYEQLVHGYWEALRKWFSPSVDATAKMMRKSEEEAAKLYN